MTSVMKNLKACKSDSERVIYLIRECGIYGLGGYDGCACTSFCLNSIHVDVSCHKSEQSIRVWCRSLEYDTDGLQLVMDAVCEALKRDGVDIEYMKRFCEYSYDNNGHWVKGVWIKRPTCCYCGKPRSSQDTYLCGECFTKPKIVAMRPWFSKK